MRTLVKEVQGIDWFDGAVMNCSWSGPLLRDVLRSSGLETEGDPASMSRGKERRHVCFSCHAVPCQEDSWYGASIPLSQALCEDAEVILALKMNGEPLPVRNGAPVRVIVPGVIGARCVKWLDGIEVRQEESENHYQRRDYKILPPEAVDAESAKEFWDSTPAMMELPLNSVVAFPSEGAVVRRNSSGKVDVKGYATPQGESGPVVKVEVSGDGGRSWTEAEILEEGETQGKRSKWAWVLWRAELSLGPGEGRRIISKATDKGGNQQQERSQWNLRGVGYNGYGENRGIQAL
ncbi:MAG: hypothetical protein Q9227_005312 [Pyrenula ochraceoflavens]